MTSNQIRMSTATQDNPSLLKVHVPKHINDSHIVSYCY